MFLESPRFPDHISAGVTFGPEFMTAISMNQGGYEQRNIVRSRALCVGECAHAVKQPAELAELLHFFRSVRGRAIAFRFKDWSDFKLRHEDSYLKFVPGQPAQFQLHKQYQVAVGFNELRPLNKLVANTVEVKEGVAVVPQGAAAGNYTVDINSGLITLVPVQTRTISSHTVGAHHAVTLASALSPNLAPGDRIGFAGVTGTAGVLLNASLHTVQAVAGALVTLQTGTVGLTATGGTAQVYRQGILTAACEFDVPVRFDTDRMATSIDAYQIYTWGQIPIVEVRL